MPTEQKTSLDEVCVLIPAFNEEKNIRRVVRDVKAFGYNVVVVDDGSIDSTSSEASLAGATVITLPNNQGKGAALRCGFEHFLKTNYQTLVIMDADGQHSPSEIKYFLYELTRGASVVVGNRMSDPLGMPPVRRLTNRFMSWVISSIAKQKIPDTQCGYRALKRNVLEKINLRTSRYEIESEMLLSAAQYGFKINSISVQSRYPEGGVSRIRPVRDTARFFRFILTYLFDRKK